MASGSSSLIFGVMFAGLAAVSIEAARAGDLGGSAQKWITHLDSLFGGSGAGTGTGASDGFDATGITCTCKVNGTYPTNPRKIAWATVDSELAKAGWPGPAKHDQAEFDTYKKTCNS